jgi:hypothetical protein
MNSWIDAVSCPREAGPQVFRALTLQAAVGLIPRICEALFQRATAGGETTYSAKVRCACAETGRTDSGESPDQ